jgi:hypothetical protein
MSGWSRSEEAKEGERVQCGLGLVFVGACMSVKCRCKNGKRNSQPSAEVIISGQGLLVCSWCSACFENKTH